MNQITVESLAEEVLQFIADETTGDIEDYNSAWAPLLELLKKQVGKTIIE